MALITGAAGGLGRAFASALAARGYGLILVDRRQDSLHDVAQAIKGAHTLSVESLCADLTSRSDIERVGRRITECDDLEILVNNAGFGITGPFAESDLRKHIDMIDVHVVASVWFSRTAVPAMISRGSGCIINVASLGGFRPSMESGVTYGATKRYLIHFSESLQAEVRRAGIKVQALCPGYVHTEFHSTSEYSSWTRSNIPAVLWMAAEEVVKTSLAALDSRKVVCIPGFRNHCLRLLLNYPFSFRVVRALLRRLS